MSVISSTDFYNWKSDPVTTMMMIVINQRIDQAKDLLASSAGINSNQDNYLRGYIASNIDILNIDLESMEEQDKC